MNYRHTKSYKTMTNYIACSIAEGFSDEVVTEKEFYSAWQWLLDTGMCWKLQGFYGRTVTDLLGMGKILPPIADHKDYYGNIVKGTEK